MKLRGGFHRRPTKQEGTTTTHCTFLTPPPMSSFPLSSPQSVTKTNINIAQYSGKKHEYYNLEGHWEGTTIRRPRGGNAATTPYHGDSMSHDCL
jgi:hypothetical protein